MVFRIGKVLKSFFFNFLSICECCFAGFSEAFEWYSKLDDSVKATYFIPNLKSKHNWTAAADYCRTKLMSIPEAKKLISPKNPPTLAMAFTNEEIDMYFSLDHIKQSENPIHIGFQRIRKTAYSFLASAYDMTITSTKNNILEYEKYHYENWERGQPSLRNDEKYGCMTVKLKGRNDCKQGEKRFICANYTYVDANANLDLKSKLYRHMVYSVKITVL